MSTLAGLTPAAGLDPPSAPVRPRLEPALAGALLLLLGGAVVPLVAGAGDATGLALQGLGCAVAVLRLTKQRGGLRRAVERLDPAVLALLVLLVLSIGWSVDPPLTVRRVAGVLAASAFGLYLAERYTLAEQMQLVLRALTVAAVLSAVLALLAPRYGVLPGGWRGVFLTKNVLARLMVLGVLTSLLLLTSVEGRLPRRRAAGCGLVCAVVLVQAGSAFAIVVLGLVLAGMALVVAVGRTRYPYRQALLVGGLTSTSAVLVLGWLERSAVLDALGRGSDLTGRVPLWHSVMPSVGDRFWFGHGYGAFWRGWSQPSDLVWLQNPWGPPHAHNGVLELVLNVGAVGVALWLLALALCLRRSLARRHGDRAAIWPVGLVVLTLAFNVTEVTLMSNALFWALFVAASSSVRYRLPPGSRTHAAAARLSP